MYHTQARKHTTKESKIDM